MGRGVLKGARKPTAATRARRLEASVAGLLPAGVSLDVRPVGDYRDRLNGSEARAVARAVPRRQREFSTGRAAARAALARMGAAGSVILVGAHREPLWPHGFVGSITHEDELCIVVACREEAARGIGVDITSSDPLEVPLRSVVSPEGAPEPPSAGGATSPDPYKVAFSAKEALYKAIFPLVRRFVGFEEVSIRIDARSQRWWSTSDSEDVRPLCSMTEGRLLVTEREIVTVAWVSSPVA